ncbi:enoyl-CoA hydratase-related protein [Hydrogenophaga sp. BPS33]|uniref:enoyl-CoA hydratase-related protein n=1 Tax=Hydrogenophaga sp. BPS33 TaxID=2651974 RepID=UPI00131F4E2A|nr:enoyl-CoA hydratase-related protein [Hydrogenophaga sp. BPS33]QHE84167.1 enoyl-CoA hydratase/isomerase family protein [Hydrogenophaga sp. BPS33]
MASVDYLAKDGRAYVTLNRPEKKNAMTSAMFEELMDAYDRAEADDDVRVVVLNSAGTDFCAGHDLAEVGKEYGETTVDEKGRVRKPSQRARVQHDQRYIGRFQRIFNSLKPTLSLVKGYCVGAGLYLAEASDLVIAADTVKMGHPEQKLGLSGAAYFAAWEMVNMGPRKARELLLLADVWDAPTVLSLGMVNKVVPLDQLEQAGEEWVERIVRLPRDGVVLGKAATNLAMDSLGISSQFSYGHILHSLATNVRYEADEFNFMKARRDKGVTASNKEREAFYVDDKKQGG